MWNASSSYQQKRPFAQDNMNSGISKEQVYASTSYKAAMMGSGVYDNSHDVNYAPYVTPKMENDNFFIGNSQTTDDRIGEWLAQEEASLDQIPLDYYKDDDNKLFHQVQVPQNLQFHPINNNNAGHTIYNNPSTNGYNVNNSRVNQVPVNNDMQYVQSITPPVVRNTELRPTSEIPSPFNSVFKFGLFNIIQSKCLDDTFYENNNLVISAPTGSGKTVLMELAIIRTLLNNGSDSKIIYMAPTKSLCSERAKDWESKFKPFGIECKEFTGDTNFASVSSVKKTTIIVTTPEKWDSMTRRWNENREIMKLISLFLIDEVHILNEKRGACLEACVSRMQTMQNNYLRFIAVSATVPNLQDIATWLKAKPISFSEDYRPIKLERFVYAYAQNDVNMFLFDRRLDWKLLDIINKHSHNKPVLIFCSTRKSAQQACDTIATMMDKQKLSTLSESGATPKSNYKFKDKFLPKYVKSGIAFHHAGLDLKDRSQIENMFLSREIRVIATTSTLAVGVNLPAHLVIIKSTQGYQTGGLTEYSDIDLLQMIGRAGRPGLDTSGCAVIMTTLEMERRYNALVSGTTNLESRLHENLIEHLASEISLGTVTDIPTALTWLSSTFLYVRVTKNPTNYKLEPTSNMSTNNILQDICVKDLELLEENNLIEKSPNGSLKATPYGSAMVRYYVKFPTMVRILKAEDPNSIKDTLELVSQSQEEIDMIRFNNGERQFLNTLKSHANIRFPLTKVASVADKINILLQCVLGDISLYNSGNSLLAVEASNIMNNVSRIIKCMIDCSIEERNPVKLKYALEFFQSIQAKIWSTSPYVARQVDGIGPQHAKTLAQASLITMEQLRNCDPGRIEVILHRNPPFGTKIKKGIDSIPNFFLHVEQSRSMQKKSPEKGQEVVTLHITLGLSNTHVNRGKYGKGYYAAFWIDTSDRSMLDFRRILISKLHQNQQKFDVQVEVTSPNMTIYCHLKSEDYIGVDVTKEVKAIVNPRRFISLANSSSISNSPIVKTEPVEQGAGIKKTTRNTKGKNNEEEEAGDLALDDDFGLDPSEWELLADTEKTSSKPASQRKMATATTRKNPTGRGRGRGRPVVTTRNKATKEVDDKQQVPKKRKKDSEELCKHRCKNKQACSHACCKLHVISADVNEEETGTSNSAAKNVSTTTKRVTRASGVKRISTYDEDILNNKASQKKLKPSPSQEETEDDNLLTAESSRKFDGNLGASSNSYARATSTYDPYDDTVVELDDQEIDDLISGGGEKEDQGDKHGQEKDDVFDEFGGLDDATIIAGIEDGLDSAAATNSTNILDHDLNTWTPPINYASMNHGGMNNMATTSSAAYTNRNMMNMAPATSASMVCLGQMNNMMPATPTYSMNNNYPQLSPSPFSNDMNTVNVSVTTNSPNYQDQEELDVLNAFDYIPQQKYADPCDALWYQAGAYVQKAFESSNQQQLVGGGMNYSSSNFSTRSSRCSGSLSPIVIGSNVSELNVASTATGGGRGTPQLQPPPMSKLFQSNSISQWVQDSVEIVYDYNQLFWHQ